MVSLPHFRCFKGPTKGVILETIASDLPSCKTSLLLRHQELTWSKTACNAVVMSSTVFPTTYFVVSPAYIYRLVHW